MLPLAAIALLVPLADPAPKAKLVKVGPNIVADLGKKTVTLNAAVCLRNGALEGLLTRKGKKEHEYLLSGDFDARNLHAALLLIGAKAGSPAQFVPKPKPASGSLILVRLRYKKAGKAITVKAGDWIKTAKGAKKLTSEFVFGGSKMVPNPEGKGPPYYIANYGDVVCLCNIDSALMDLPFASPKALDDRVYSIDTDAVPAMGTAVEVVFTVVKK